MVQLRRAVLVAGLAALVSVAVPFTPVTAAPPVLPAETASNAAKVQLPFNPALGTPIRYRIEHRSWAEQGGQRQNETVIRSEAVVTFLSRNDQGYVAEWKTTSVAVEAPQPIKMLLETGLAAVIDLPLHYQTDAYGRPLTVTNWAEMQPRLVWVLEGIVDQSVAAFSSLPEEARGAIRKAMDGMVDSYRTMTQEKADVIILEEARRMFGFGGLEAEVGAARLDESWFMLPYLDEAGRMVIRTTLADYQPQKGLARLEINSVLDPEDLKLMVEKVAHKLMAGGGMSEEQAKAIAETRLNLTLREEQSVDISLPTGVPKNISYKKVLEEESVTKIESWSYLRLP